jgi:hypothetical protein
MKTQDNFSPNKIKVKKTVNWVCQNKPFTWKDIKNFEFEDDDEIAIWYDDGDDRDEHYQEGDYILDVHRVREETDEEFQKRMLNNKQFEESMKVSRYKTYLRLKEEFEKI